MLVLDPEQRTSLDDMLQSNWVTNNKKEIIELKQVEYDQKNKKGEKQGFGNLGRLLEKRNTSSDFFVYDGTNKIKKSCTKLNTIIERKD